jgi:hypothetical protein
MGKKRKKIFETREEYEAWKTRSDELIARLRRRGEMIQAELASKRQEQGPA